MSIKSQAKAAAKAAFSSPKTHTGINTYKLSADIEDSTLSMILAMHNFPKAAKTVKVENNQATCVIEGNVSALMFGQLLKDSGFKHTITPLNNSHDISKVKILDSGIGQITSMMVF